MIKRLLATLLVGIFGVSTCCANSYWFRKEGSDFLKINNVFQKTTNLDMITSSTWSGDGTDNSWTTPQNWNNTNYPYNNGKALITFPIGCMTHSAGSNINVNLPRDIWSLTINDYYTFTNQSIRLSGGLLTTTLPALGLGAVFENNIELGTNATFAIFSGGEEDFFRINGIISGPYDLSMTGLRTLILSNNMTYSGSTINSNGLKLYLYGTNATTALRNNIGNMYVMGANTGVTNTTLNGGILYYAQSDSIGNGTIIFRGGSLGTTTIGTMVMTNNVIVNGNIVLNLPVGTATNQLTSDLVLDTNRTFSVNSGWSYSYGVLSGVISGPYALTIDTIRMPTLSGNNTYSGGTIVKQAAQFTLANSNAAGTGLFTIMGDTNATTVQQLSLCVKQDTTLTNVSIMDDFGFNINASDSSLGNLTFLNTIPLSGPNTNYTINIGASLFSRLLIEGTLVETNAGAKGITFTGGNGKIRLGGNNQYSGPTTFSSLNNYDSFGSSTSGVYVANNNAFGTGQIRFRFDDPNLGSRYVYIAAEPGPVTITNSVYIADMASNSLNWDIRLGGNITFNGPFSGVVTNGETPKITIKSNATVAATGIIPTSVVVAGGGTLGAGSAVGALNIQSNVTFNAGAFFSVDIPSNSVYDRVTIDGTLALGNATLTNAPVTGYMVSTDLLFTAVVTGPSSISGVFTNAPQGTLYNLGPYDSTNAFCRVSYVGDFATKSTNGGNDMVLYGFDIPKVIISFGIASQTNPTAPIITGSTLPDSWVTWTDPLGNTTNSKTPAASFFTANPGQYTVGVPRIAWNRVTAYTFEQSSARSFLTNLTVDPSVVAQQTALTSFTTTYNTNAIAYSSPLLPVSTTNVIFRGNGNTGPFPEVNSLTNINSLNVTWAECSKQQNEFPAVSNLTKVTDLYAAWYTCSGMTGAFPYVNSLTNVNTLQSTWWACNGQTIAFPDVSNLVKATTLKSTWESCTAMTGAFPYVNNMTNVAGDLNYTWGTATACKHGFPAVSNLTLVTGLNATWYGATSYTGTLPEISTLTNVTSMNSTYFNMAANTNRLPMVDTLTKLTTVDSAWLQCAGVPNMPLTNSLPLCTTYHDAFAVCSSMIGNIGDWTWRTNIVHWDSYNSLIAYTNRPGCFATNVANGINISMAESKLPQGDVSQILIDLDASGATNGILNVGGASFIISNAAPNSLGWYSLQSLTNKGWTVTANGTAPSSITNSITNQIAVIQSPLTLTSTNALNVTVGGSAKDRYIRFYTADTTGASWDSTRVMGGAVGSSSLTSTNFVKMVVSGVPYYLQVFGGDLQTDPCSNLSGVQTNGSFTAAGFIPVDINRSIQYLQVWTTP